MTIRILVNGANGKMGVMTVKTLEQHPDFTIVGTTSRNDDLAQAIKETHAKIVIDLTHADAVFKNTEIIIHADAHPIIGTSGLIKEQINQLQKQCREKKLGGIIAPNFSLGAVLMMKYSQHIAKYFPDVEIIEMHHDKKIDSPSGSALRTAEMIAKERTPPPPKKIQPLETIRGARGAIYQDIPIHAIRLPGLLAHQEVIFGRAGETLTIRHDTTDRECYMSGIIVSCQKVTALKELVYGLENLL